MFCTPQPSSAPSVADWHPVAERRVELLAAVCKNGSLRNLTHVSVGKFVLDRIFVCDKHKILFCQTPKVGNTQWKKVLIVLNGRSLRLAAFGGEPMNRAVGLLPAGA